MLRITADNKAFYEHANGKLPLGDLTANAKGSFQLKPTKEFWQRWEHDPMPLQVAGFWVDKEQGKWRVQLDRESYTFAFQPRKPDRVVTLRHHQEYGISLESCENVGEHPNYAVRRHGELVLYTDRIQDAIREWEMLCKY